MKPGLEGLSENVTLMHPVNGHGWAINTYDMGYGCAFEVPEREQLPIASSIWGCLVCDLSLQNPKILTAASWFCFSLTLQIISEEK